MTTSLRSEPLTPSLRSSSRTPSLRSARLSPSSPISQLGNGSKSRERQPERQPNPVMRNFPLFFDGESNEKKRPKEKKSSKERKPKEYKSKRKLKMSGGGSTSSQESGLSLNTWDSVSHRSALGPLTEDDSVYSGQEEDSERGAGSPGSEREGESAVCQGGVVSPHTGRGLVLQQSVTGPVLPWCERGSERDPAPASGESLVSLLCRRGRNSLSPLRRVTKPSSAGSTDNKALTPGSRVKLRQPILSREPASVVVEEDKMEEEKPVCVSYALHHFTYTTKTLCSGER